MTATAASGSDVYNLLRFVDVIIVGFDLQIPIVVLRAEMIAQSNSANK
jgi:hypothetical protein